MVKTEKQNRSGIHIGQQTTAWMGLDFHLPVFLISAVLVILLVVATLVMPQWFGAPLLEPRVWISTKFDWYFILQVNLFLLFLLYLVVSRLGDRSTAANNSIFLEPV